MDLLNISNLLVYGLGFVVAIYIGILTVKKYVKPKNKTKRAKTIGEDKVYQIRDSKELIPFDSISDKMYVMNGGTRFVASMTCVGFDYFIANPAERDSTADGYLSFVRTIQNPIMMRFDSATVDLSHSIKRHEEALEREQAELDKIYERCEQYNTEYKSLTDESDREEYRRTLAALQKDIEVREQRLLHLDNLIEYQVELSGLAAHPIREQRYIFSWDYDPSQFLQEPTPEEIYAKAKRDLDDQFVRMKNALEVAHVKCVRDNNWMLKELAYRFYHPYGADKYKSAWDTNHEQRIVSGAASLRSISEKAAKFILEEQEKEEKRRLLQELEEADRREREWLEEEDYAQEEESEVSQ